MGIDIYDLIKKNLTVALTVLTGFTYFCTYQYEKGSCDYFNIPYDFIEIGITNLIVFVSLFVVIIGLSYIFIETFFFEIPEGFSGRPLIQTAIRTNTYYIAAILVVYLVWDFRITAIIGLGISGALSNYLDIKKHKTLSKLVQEEQEHILNRSPNIKRSILHKMLNEKFQASSPNGYWLTPFVFIFIMILTPMVIQRIGNTVSKKETHWLKLEERPSLVLLKKYGDNYIFRPFEKNHLIGKMVIIRQDPEYPLSLKDTLLTIQSFNPPED